MSGAPENDPFRVDAARRELAQKGDLSALRASYESGSYPELEDLSSTELWDDLANYEVIPAFRIRRLRAVADRLPSRAKVLDIGVGWGEIIPMLQESGERHYVGIDFSEKIVAQVAARHPDCRFHVGGLEQIDEKFDVVLALEVCEHILASRIFTFYAEIRRVLRKGGTLIVSVPVFEDLKASTLRCPKCGHMHSRMGHVRSYTPELIRTELMLAGFKVTDSFFIYANFGNTLAGRVKRAIVDLGRLLLKLGRTRPLGIVLVARPQQEPG